MTISKSATFEVIMTGLARRMKKPTRGVCVRVCNTAEAKTNTNPASRFLLIRRAKPVIITSNVALFEIVTLQLLSDSFSSQTGSSVFNFASHSRRRGS